MDNLLTKIKNEPVSLTNKITYGKEKQDYFIYWTMEGRKTIFETGMIMVVDNNKAEYSYIKAFEKKYDVEIPDTDIYFETIMDKLQECRK